MKPIKNAPNKIYLQIGEDTKPTDNFNKLREISWCKDKINENDLEYVLSARSLITDHIADANKKDERLNKTNDGFTIKKDDAFIKKACIYGANWMGGLTEPI